MQLVYNFVLDTSLTTVTEVTTVEETANGGYI